MNSNSLPLVSCIMPTYNRRQFVPNAIKYFLRQDYENKELIIVDDGTDVVNDLIPEMENIRYYRLDNKITLGAKLNIACQYAKGDIIANWDDDDWYADWRLQYQMAAIQKEDIEVCGINNLIYYDLIHKKGYQYIYPENQKVWLSGSSLCFTKAHWKENKFADINMGMDGLFVWATPRQKIEVLEDNKYSVLFIHGENVSPKKTQGSWWYSFDANIIKETIGKDWAHYGGDFNVVEDNKKIEKPTVDSPKIYGAENLKIENENSIRNGEGGKKKNRKLLKNVFVCLVHEKEDCIIDLVRNLQYHDPTSIILLYDGSPHGKLLQKKSLFENLNVKIHPSPKPQHHGYLHQFALDCLTFATENFYFDTITIVDSDQLCIRKGYSQFISNALSGKPNVGMFSSNPIHFSNHNSHLNFVAKKALGEFDLWRPFLESFPEGINKFVHWTFWPSSVFTKKAVEGIVQLFAENKLLQHIMSKTKIWATEEVIFPTIVKLLGYEIIENPCSYEFVKYKVTFREHDLMSSLTKEKCYWMHPVERRYDDLLRKKIRNNCNHYFTGNKLIESTQNEFFFDINNLLKKVEQVEGWLQKEEALLLISVAIQSCLEFKKNYAFVEIGSYHGKASILLGNIVKYFSPNRKVFCIDPHDGQIGSAENGYLKVSGSYEKLKENVKDNLLLENIHIIKSHSRNVAWSQGISLLIIDGLHDYHHVAEDFWHFSNWIVPKGFVAFHDYADYFLGVMTFVNELISSGRYIKIKVDKSMIILQKKESDQFD